jgi:eukaryotic-like serine/threonine-protein kinase
LESATPRASGFGILSVATGRPFLVAAAAAATLLVGTGLLAWHFANGSNRNQSDNGTAVGVPTRAMPALEIEKLIAGGRNRFAAISPDGKFVAYTNEAKGHHSIWLRQLATSTAREIVSFAEGAVFGLAFAHSGERLYFVKGRPEPTALYRVPLPFGGLPSKIVDKPEGTFSLSPDDGQVAFVRETDGGGKGEGRASALMIAATDGSLERALAVHTEPDGFSVPAWSPDGRTIAVAIGSSDSGRQELRVVEVNVADASQKQLSAERWIKIKRMVWLPDKSALILVGSRRIEETNLWRMSYPGGEVSQVSDGLMAYTDISITTDARTAVAPQATSASNLWVGSSSDPQNLTRITQASGNFCWTPDGRIIYSSYASVNSNLWVIRPDGTEQQQLTIAGESGNPAVTPDGRYIVFTSNRAGVWQIWRMNADGSNQIQLTSGRGANFPAVSVDGHWVVYNEVSDWRLWKVSIDGGRPVLLTDGFASRPSVSPDGKLIASMGKDNQQTRRLDIIPFTGGRPLQELAVTPMWLSSHRWRWTPDARALLYLARRDGISGMYRQSLDGGAPEKLVDFNEDDIFDFGYSPSGQQLAVTRGGWRFDVVLIKVGALPLHRASNLR